MRSVTAVAFGLSIVVWGAVGGLMQLEPLPSPVWLPVAKLPWVNAALNSTCAALLAAAFLAVRTGRESLHGLLMSGGMLLSTAFLVSYVAYHAFSPSEVVYDGPGRGAYLALLASHIVLAAAVLPFVLMTWARGFLGQRAAHKAIAVPTFCVWLYVLVSGVAIVLLVHG